LEKYDDALSFTNEILEDMPQHENALYYKWKAHKWLWNTSQAIDAFTKLLEVNPNNQYAAAEYDELTAE
jgi:tetratricopeptide (TPR) repeat protein